MGDGSQDQNPSAHSAKYASILDGPLFSYTPNHAKPNDSKQTHNEATDIWYGGLYPTLRCKRWRYEEQIQNTCRLQRASMENVGEGFGRSTSSGAKCSILNSRHDFGLPDSSACLNKKQSSVPHKKWSFFPTAPLGRPKPTYPALIMWSQSKIKSCRHLYVEYNNNPWHWCDKLRIIFNSIHTKYNTLHET